MPLPSIFSNIANKLGINTPAPESALDVTGRVRARDASSGAPGAGKGVEIHHDGTQGTVESVNRDAGAHQHLVLRGSTVEVIAPSGLTLAVPAWTSISSYSNNWAQYAPVSDWATAQWWKDPFGVVHLKGLVKRTSGTHTSFETMATLPAGSRPPERLLFNARCQGGTVRVDVAPDGTIQIVDDPVSGTPEGYTSLDGITFRTT